MSKNMNMKVGGGKPIIVPKMNFTKLSTTAKSSNGEFSRLNIGKLSTISNSNFGCLGYTFRSKKETISKSKNEKENYMYDLSNTLTLNMQMILSFLTTSPNNEQNKSLTKTFNFIQSLFTRRKKLIQMKSNIKSKILISNQILEEYQRNNDEYKVSRQEELKDLTDAVSKKKIYFRQFQSKFNEVEVYVQRECKNVVKWKKKFCEYEISPFIALNCQLNFNMKNLNSQIEQLKKDILTIAHDNFCLNNKNKEEQKELEAKGNNNKEMKENINKEKLYCGNYTLKQYNNLVSYYQSMIKLLINEKMKLYNKLDCVTNKSYLASNDKDKFKDIISNKIKNDKDNNVNPEINKITNVEKNDVKEDEEINESIILKNKKSRNNTRPLAANNKDMPTFMLPTGTVLESEMAVNGTRYKDNNPMATWNISRIDKVD